MPADNTILIENAELKFLNFRGLAGQYNAEGSRNFCLMINDDKLLKRLETEGWNVKHLKAREEGDVPRPYLQVAVNFKGRPPRIVMITSRGHTDLDENSVDLLDWVEIDNVDLIIRPYDWEVNGRGGKKAYLKSIFVTIAEDYLERKYAEVLENKLPEPSPDAYS